MLAFLFGCWHKRTTFPQTPSKGGRTYVVCLDCGKEFDYDFQQMKVTKGKRTKTNGEKEHRQYA